MRTLFLAFLACSFALSSFAQTGSNMPGASNPRIGFGDPSIPSSVFVTGKVVSGDGSEITEPVTIQTICRGRKHTETYTDSHGGFSFSFVTRDPYAYVDFADADTTMSGGPSRTAGPRNVLECDLQATLPGFSSEMIHLATRIRDSQNADVGQIVLHRLERVEGFTISATTLMAPGPAKKAWEKGRSQEKKKHWDDAQRSFEKAVQIYPKFATAWFELGRLQLQKSNFAGAKLSFQNSLAADPKYVNPYHGLAQVALHDQKWPEVIDITGKLLTLDPVSYPDAWFYNAVGNYQVHNFDAAEKSARECTRLDDEHRIPKLEYLLGLILMQKHNFPEATEHIRAFLKIASEPADIAEAHKRLDEIASLTPRVLPPASNSEQKK